MTDTTKKHAPRRRLSLNSKRGAMLLELAIYFGLVLLLLVGGALGYKKFKEDSRESLCVANMHKIWDAKRTAWIKYEDLTTVSDPDSVVMEYLDVQNMPFCPTPGTQVPAQGVKATTANTLASYNLAATTETANPVCRILPAKHAMRN